MRKHFAAAALACLWIGCVSDTTQPKPTTPPSAETKPEPPAEFEGVKVHYRDVGTGSRAIV